jgi:hypothetical protein
VLPLKTKGHQLLIDYAVVVDELAAWQADDDAPTAAKDYAWRRAPEGDHSQAEDDLTTAAKDYGDVLQKGSSPPTWWLGWIK